MRDDDDKWPNTTVLGTIIVIYAARVQLAPSHDRWCMVTCFQANEVIRVRVSQSMIALVVVDSD